MVGRHHQHQAVAEAGQRAQGGERHRRCRVAAGRLEQRAAAAQVDTGEVGTNSARMAFGGDQENRRLTLRPLRQAAHRLDQHRAVAGKIMELLGVILTRQRPQP